jgi:hypothetical protein
MEVSNMTRFAYIVREHLDYHMRLGMSGMWMMCDAFVCLELLQDSELAQRGAEGMLVLWSWVSDLLLFTEITMPCHSTWHGIHCSNQVDERSATVSNERLSQRQLQGGWATKGTHKIQLVAWVTLFGCSATQHTTQGRPLFAAAGRLVTHCHL